MQARHQDRARYFNEQALTTQKFVIPFLGKSVEINEKTAVLEIGCGEAGNLKPFVEMGCGRIVGVDLAQARIDCAKEYLKQKSPDQKIELLCEDIYDSKDLGKFDIIMLRDVIEHIHNQEKFMRHLKQFVKPNGVVFFGFPPWYNPFGGHQQICKSRVLSKLPFFHILPKPIYKGILKLFGESKDSIEDLLEIKETGISIERFERILKKENYTIRERIWYFINPNYETKFGLKPRKQLKLFTSIPFLRNFLVTAGYYAVTPEDTLGKLNDEISEVHRK